MEVEVKEGSERNGALLMVAMTFQVSMQQARSKSSVLRIVPLIASYQVISYLDLSAISSNRGCEEGCCPDRAISLLL